MEKEPELKVDILGLETLDQMAKEEQQHEDDIPMPVPKRGTDVPRIDTLGPIRFRSAADPQYIRIRTLNNRLYGPPIKSTWDLVAHVFCFLVEIVFVIVFIIGMLTIISWLT